MSLPSLVPEVHVDVASLPLLLPRSLRYYDLYPYSDLFSHIVSTRPGCPSWNAELEAYYQTFHPSVWVYLSIDHNNDTRALRQLRSRLGELRKSKLKREPEDGASVDELESAIKIVQLRQLDRWNKLFGLLDIRDKYIQHQQDLFPREVHYEIKKAAVRAMESTEPAAARRSLWPLFLPPPIAGLVSLRDQDVDWSKYALPDRPTPKSEDAWRDFEAAQVAHGTKGHGSSSGESGRDDEAAPLLAVPFNGARSSGLSRRLPVYFATAPLKLYRCVVTL
ncbi:hypothetical protein RTBOTA2_001994 [Rhodotorula toruloides]|nr:hypothetical protein RTBOTA2_001994 [Rhodotorula toruloides]